MVALDMAKSILSVDYAKESNSLESMNSLPSAFLRQKTRQAPPKLGVTRSPSVTSSPQVGGVWGDERWQIIEFGTPGSLRYRMLFLDRKDGREMSPWHQVPLFTSNNNLNFLCKTPRGSWAKYEIAENEHFHPLRLTAKQGWPAHFTSNATWNYGMLPQTWADPTLQNEQFRNVVYDGNPVEVVEIGSRSSWTGEVYQVKPLGAFAVIEGPNLSWKVVAIAADDPLASILKSVNDINRSLPGMLDEIREWLRTCNCLDGNDAEGQFGLYELPAEHEETMRQIEIAHKSWQILSAHQILPDPCFPRLTLMKSSTYETFWAKYTENSSDASIPLSDFGLGTKWKRGKSNETPSSSGASTPSRHRRELLGFLRPKSRLTQVQPLTPTAVKSFGPTVDADDSDYAPKSSRCGLNLFVRSADDNSILMSTRKETIPSRLHRNISWDEKNLRSLLSPDRTGSPKVAKPARLVSHSSWDLSKTDYSNFSSPSRPIQHVIPPKLEVERHEKSHPSDLSIESTASKPGKRNETSRLLKNRLRGNVSLGINIPTNNEATKLFNMNVNSTENKKSADNGLNSAQTTPTGTQQPKPVPVSPSLMSPKSWLSAIGLSSTLSPKSSPRNALKNRDVRGYEGERGEKGWSAGGGLDSPDSSKLWNLGSLMTGKMKYDRMNSPNSKGSLPSPGSNRGGIGGTAIARMVKDFTVEKREDKNFRVLISPRGREVRVEEGKNGKYMSAKFYEPQWGHSMTGEEGGGMDLRNGSGRILRTSSMPITFDVKKEYNSLEGYRSSLSSPSGNSVYEGMAWQSPGENDNRLVRTRSQGRRVTFSEKVEVKLFKSEGKQSRGEDGRKGEEKEGSIEKKDNGEKEREKEIENENNNSKISSLPNALSRKEMQQKSNARYYKSMAPSLKSSSRRANPDDYVWQKALESVSTSGFVERYDMEDEKRNGEKHNLERGNRSSLDKEYQNGLRQEGLSPRFNRNHSGMNNNNNHRADYSRSDYGGGYAMGRSTIPNLSPLNPLSRANAEARLERERERERERSERGESSPKFVNYYRGRRVDPFEMSSPDRISNNPNYSAFRPSYTGSGELIPSLGRRMLSRKAIKGGSGELLPLPYSTSPPSFPLRRTESSTMVDLASLKREEGDLLLLNKSGMENGSRESKNGNIPRRREELGRSRISREERRERMLAREDSYFSPSDSDSSWTSASSPQHHLLKLNLLESRQNSGKQELTKKKWDVKENGEERTEQGKGEKVKISQHHPQSPNNKEMRMGGRISVQQPFSVYVS